MSRNPLFDAMLVVQNMEHEELLLDGLHIQNADVSRPVSKFDVTLQASEGGDRFIFCLNMRRHYSGKKRCSAGLPTL